MGSALKRVITVCNQKGGVGKTTTAINLATALAAIGRRVTLIDMDPQSNSTSGLGVPKDRANRANIYKVLTGETSLKDALWQHQVPCLSVVPANRDLLGFEIEFSKHPDRMGLLKKYIADEEMDYTIIDSPPAMSLLSGNALVAATDALVPLQSEFFALEGLSQLLESIQRVKQHLNPDLQMLGILVTMFDPRNRQSQDIYKKCQSLFRGKIFDTIIPRNARISEASSYGQPILLYDMKCRGAQAYLSFAREIIQRLEPKHND